MQSDNPPDEPNRACIKGSMRDGSRCWPRQCTSSETLDVDSGGTVNVAKVLSDAVGDRVARLYL